MRLKNIMMMQPQSVELKKKRAKVRGFIKEYGDGSMIRCCPRENIRGKSIIAF
jgi:hypothetical protein